MRYAFLFIVSLLLAGCTNAENETNTIESENTDTIDNTNETSIEEESDQVVPVNNETNDEEAQNEVQDLNESEQEEQLIAETSVGDITETEYIETLKEMHGEEVLQLLVSEKVFANEAENLGITEEDIEAELSFLMETMGLEDPQELYEVMEAQGVRSETELRERVLQHLVMQELTNTDGEIDEDTLMEEYEKGQEVNARHILVSDEETAVDLIDRLEDGADFGELAAEYSQDPGSSEEEGELGFFRRGTMSPPFEAAAFTLEEGERSDPVASQFGYHIIEVLERIPFDDPYEEVSEQLYSSLNERMLYERNQKEAELMENIDITIYDESLESTYED